MSREVIYSIQLLYMSIVGLKVPLVSHVSKHQGSVCAEWLGALLLDLPTGQAQNFSLAQSEG